MKIQPMLDKILPTLIPVMITAAAYYLLSKKKISMTILILLVIVFAMVMAAFGILA
jgi:PTS system mannose-specific IID component